MYWTWCVLVPFLDLCSTAEGFLCHRKSSCTSFYPAYPQGILPFFFCSLNSQSFLLYPALTFILAVTSSCFMHLPWSFFLNPFQHQQQKVVIHFHSVKSLKKLSGFFLLLLLFSLSICYLVCFSFLFYGSILWTI